MKVEKHGFDVGATVAFVGSHPWAGHTGKVVREEKTPFGYRPVVELKDFAGHQVFIMSDKDAQVVEPSGGKDGK